MKKEDIQLYREIQKNARMGQHAINTVSPKVYDDSMALMLTRDSMRYNQIGERAKEELLKVKVTPEADNKLENLMLSAAIHANTLLNTSSEHIAGMLIQGSNMGINRMWKTLGQNTGASLQAVELAKELMDFEESNIKELKKYL